MEKEAYWFKHDSNAKDDPKCMMLIEELGIEGYGIFWILVETLRNQPGYKANLCILPALARRFNTTLEKIKAVVTRYELFVVDEDEFFFSESLNNRMEKLDDKREKARMAGMKSGEVRRLKSDNEQTLNGRSTNPERIEKNRVEKNKTFAQFWEMYDKKKDRKKCLQKWHLLSDSDIQAILQHLPKYIKATPDKQFRKDPATYLNNRSWEDEYLPETQEQSSEAPMY